ncbi:GFA family protein [Photobacterium sp. SP02]|uniref:GFA family protein n=1 Tax=Photobacterium sp. SP02 TaxID=3032280 RepID=UPI00406C2B4E
MSNRYQGSCLCRGVQFSVNGFSEQAANCYCSMCRKFHGAAFGTLVGVQGLNWFSGEHLQVSFITSRYDITNDHGTRIDFWTILSLLMDHFSGQVILRKPFWLSSARVLCESTFCLGDFHSEC